MLDILSEELSACGLSLNADKTRIFTNDVAVSNVEEPLVLQLAVCQLPVMTSQVFHKYFGKKIAGGLRSRSACNSNYRMESAWVNSTLTSSASKHIISVRLRLKFSTRLLRPLLSTVFRPRPRQRSSGH